MKRICVLVVPLVLGLAPAWSLQSQTGQTAEQQSQAADQQSQTAAQQSQTAQQQSQTAQQGKAAAQQQSKTAQQQSQTAAQQSTTAAQQAQTAAQQSATAQQQSQTAAQQSQIAAQQTQHATQQQQQEQQAQTAATQEDLAKSRAKQADRLHNSRDVLNTALNAKLGITKALIDNAKCVIVVPSLKRAGFVFGVDYGRGAMSCRLGEDFKGPWSAPAMYAIEGGNFGLQIGVQVTDLVLLVMNERGVNSLLSTKSKLGVDASLAAGPFGKSVMGATDLGMRADILAFSRTGGAYLGAVLNGSTLRPDGGANEALYGRELTARQIVRSGEVPVPAPGRPLIQRLDETKVAAVEAPPKNASK